MVHAFVMVKTAAGKSESLLAEVRDEPHVVEAHIVAGEYDIIAEVEVDEVYQVLDASSSGIQALSGVNDTKTYISLD
ncbi:Lrp/AsnC family transcriptional regulator [Natranaeroarchaeum aerophilus]|uniref:Lrp/AsnC ligand binding domain-containing protein n=1 Tax=Natranaeroarchaeum aerophilus TaxID=2917711 RepID=A0AAE3FRT3_9EURY|nr:Lrp/AsnC ligand binding domain-containing protein [Natranaeroarchaeum aerophilus]MCL9813693.1 Lrp/AsnC ligand binding domain-containing protein [Natranaeroarchaeum aerophilus]